MPGRDLTKLPAFVDGSSDVSVVIECPAGSRVKSAYRPDSDIFHLSYVLPKGSSFPFAFGFIPSTIADDGDPLDMMVLLEVPIAVGSTLTARPIGMIEADQTQDGKTFRNNRLIGVALASRAHAGARTLADVDPKLLDEIELFFVSYNKIRGREFKPIRRTGPEDALDLIRRAMRKRDARD